MDAEARIELVELYMQVARGFGEHWHAVAQQYDLTPMQAMTLFRLGGSALPTKDIARHLHCDPSNATGLVDQLERRGLVRRTTPPHDRRVRAVEATDEGRAVDRGMRQGLASAIGAFDRLDDAETAELRRLLKILASG